MTRLRIRRSLLGAAGAVALAMLVFPASVWAQRQTETVDRTLPFPSGGTLKLNNFSGDVRITVGTGRNFVMKAVRRADADVLKEIQLSVDSSGATITVEANKRDRETERRRNNRNNVVDTDFEIQVPAGARLDINTFSSDVAVVGVEGAQRIETFSGDIEIDAMAQGTSPELDVETFSGTMRMRLSDKARGDVEFDSFSGSFDADYPVSLRSSSRRNIRATLPGGPGGPLRFKSFSGDLRLVK